MSSIQTVQPYLSKLILVSSYLLQKLFAIAPQSLSDATAVFRNDSLDFILILAKQARFPRTVRLDCEIATTCCRTKVVRSGRQFTFKRRINHIACLGSFVCACYLKVKPHVSMHTHTTHARVRVDKKTGGYGISCIKMKKAEKWQKKCRFWTLWQWVTLWPRNPRPVRIAGCCLPGRHRRRQSTLFHLLLLSRVSRTRKNFSLPL